MKATVLEHERLIDLACEEYLKTYSLQTAESELQARVTVAIEILKQRSRAASYVVNEGELPAREIIGRKAAK